jgi:predicted RNA binding protein YcfA (HicA-like mRNA interferase family)
VKLPRDVSGAEFAHALRHFGYEIVRQTGSHMRLARHHLGVEQHVTIPSHKSLKIGTLNNILGDVSLQVGLPKEALIEKPFR